MDRLTSQDLARQLNILQEQLADSSGQEFQNLKLRYEKQEAEIAEKNQLLMDFKFKVDALEAQKSSENKNKKRRRLENGLEITDDIAAMLQTTISQQSTTFSKMIEKMDAQQANMAAAIDIIHNTIRTTPENTSFPSNNIPNVEPHQENLPQLKYNPQPWVSCDQ